MRSSTVRKVPAIVVWPGLAATLLAAVASAQSDEQVLAELRECARIQIDRARLNCVDGVFADDALAGRSADADDGTEGTASPAASRTGVADPGQAGAAVATSAVAATEAEREPERGRPPPASRDDEEVPAERIVTVVEVIELGRGNFRFVTSDGEVYTQPIGSPPRRNYPSVPFEAELGTGAFGSLFIRPVEGGPRTRVAAED
jgi:hypothetical protein